MPAQRKADGETPKIMAPKSPRSPKKVKKDEPVPADGEYKTGPWSSEDEKRFLLFALMKSEFKLSKVIRDGAAELLGRKSKAVNNYYYGTLVKQMRQLDQPHTQGGNKSGVSAEGEGIEEDAKDEVMVEVQAEIQVE